MDCTSSTPRTPSPTDLHFLHGTDHKHDALAVFQPSLLQELYNDADIDSPYPEPLHHQQQQQQQQQGMVYRRATFPYVRHDREDIHLYPSAQPFLHHHQPAQHNFYPDSASYYPPSSWPAPDVAVKHEDLSATQPHLIVPSQSQSLAPHSLYNQQAFFPQHALPAHHQQQQQQQQQQTLLHHHQQQQPLPPPLSYLPHSSMPVQHTDDAASKETQYLRRRRFNCHTTEPPSWRRSTLNPGKIVCNKCGLYERTHLRPRPLRFDELRAGNKARKNSSAAQQQAGQGVAGGQGAVAGAGRKESASPKVKGASVKKEPREYGVPRRASVSSSASSASGASDWDDNLSVYSSPSAPPTSFNSPSVPSFPLSRDSQSPPILDPSLSSLSPSLSSSLSQSSLSSLSSPLPPLSDSSSASSPSASSSSSHSIGGSPNPQGMIRLPNAPLSDIASYSPHHAHQQLQQYHHAGGASPLSSPPLAGHASLPQQHHGMVMQQQQQQQQYSNYNGMASGYNGSSTMSFAVQPMYGFDTGMHQQSSSSYNNNNTGNGMGTGLMGPPSPLSSIPSLPSTPSTPSINASSLNPTSSPLNNVTPTTAGRRRSSTSSSLAVSPQALSLGLGIAEESEHEGREEREGEGESGLEGTLEEREREGKDEESS
ncbi:hypothetical protein PLEOSDRAFT_1112373 [Pleurotus ostreatus PC15]|uniref:GATA-type domain-containing protein n=2 Tax=Pleurotus TaxID=5320 RepID=A0A067NNH1_PLEO1|nr:hypothetical protein CCMSSC00406_0001157 [Pleurotus cornucopiae]KDQ29628.1 hypothetical protein PLEOSDRAFT_1112373 [Pleurotus ostreatus PC15]